MIETQGKQARIGEFIGLVDRRIALAVFFLLLGLYTATFNGPAASPDAEVSFQTTSALWRTGSLAIGGTPEAAELIERARVSEPGAFPVRPGVSRDGEPRYYGWYGVGQALVALPFYALGDLLGAAIPGLEQGHALSERYGTPRSEYFAHLAVGWRTPLLAAMTAMLIVMASLRLGVSRKTAFIGGLGYGATTFAWPQALTDLSDVQATFFVALASYALLVLRDRTSRRVALLFGLSLGLGFLTRASLAPLVVWINMAFVISCTRSKRTRRGETTLAPAVRRKLLGWGLVPQLAVFAIWLGLNHLRFGDALDSGYGEALSGGLFSGDPLRAALGLLVSPGKGLLWMAPAAVFAFAGVRRARRSGQHGVALFVMLSFVAVFLPAVFLRGWHGAWTYGPRYLLPALPAVWALASVGFARAELAIKPRPAALACLFAGLVIQLPAVLVDTFTYHELAVAAAQERFEVAEGLPASDSQAQRFDAMHFDWGFAAPWAHWRILRHRVAGLGEEFLASEIFRFETGLELAPAQEREQGFRHLAWVDLSQRLGGVIWPAVAVIVLLLGLGLIFAVRGLDPA